MKQHFKVSQQYDSMQCGIACIQMICNYYGQKYSIDELSNFCFATHEGVSLLGISRALEKLGFATICVKASVNIFTDSNLPCILHWNQNHFVVLFKVKKNKFYVADPSKGKVVYSYQDLKKHWIGAVLCDNEQGIALLIEKTDSFGKIISSKHPKKMHSFQFLFSYLKRYSTYFFQIFLGLLLGCIFQLIMPFLTQGIVDIGIAHKDIDFICLILLGQLLIVLGRAATDFIRRWLLLHISMRVNISLVSDFFIKLLKLPMSFFDTKLIGDLLQRMNDYGRIQSFLTLKVLNILFSLLSFLIFGLVLFIYEKIIFFVFLLGSIFYGFWIAIFLHKRKILDYELFEQQALNQNKTYQFVTTMQEIKLQDCESRRRWEWEDIQADLFQIQIKSLKLQQTQEAGSIFINEVKNIIITVLAATQVINGNLTLGAMLAIQYIVGQLNLPVEQLMSFIYSLQDVRISLERINEIYEKEDEDKYENNKSSFSLGINNSIEFKSVDFKYDPNALKFILKDISFTIPFGKTTAIVGASGSGKTTLIKLLLGFYQVSGGNILIGNDNLNHYNLKWWRRQCGVVMQDGVIFSESIARNIAVGDGQIDFSHLYSAAKIANIHEFIMSLPLQYNTKVGCDGVGLSQGQKQRILIARAVYKNPTFLFFDEATNSLDSENERTIVESLENFYRGRTVLIVAHRLSTVKNADQIIVLNAGIIVEQGNHTSLLEKKGVYYNLIKNQLELGN